MQIQMMNVEEETMRLFILKMAAVAAFIASVLALDNLLMGAIGVLPGLALLLLCGFVTVRLFLSSLGLGKRRAAKRRRARRTAAAMRSMQAGPVLQVANGGRSPHGPKAA